MLDSVTIPSVFAQWCLWKIGAYSPSETRRQGSVCVKDYIAKKDGSQVLDKDTPGLYKIYIFNRQRKTSQLQIL